MHAKSGYTAYRVAKETAAEYYRVQQEASLVDRWQRSIVYGHSVTVTKHFSSSCKTEPCL